MTDRHKLLWPLLVLMGVFLYLMPEYGEGADLEKEAGIRVEMSLSPISNGLLDNGFPSDIYRAEDGSLQWTQWSHPTVDSDRGELMEHWFYKTMLAGGSGFSPMMNLYIRFDQYALNDEDLCRDKTCADSVLLIDINPASKTYGTFQPLEYTINITSDPLYGGMLQVHPVGSPLKENNTYALIVKRRLLKSPYYLAQSSALRALLHQEQSENTGEAVYDSYFPVYEPLRRFLEEKHWDIDDIAGAMVWTTGQPTQRLRALTKQVLETADEYISRDSYQLVGRVREHLHEDYCVIKGTWDVPLFLDSRGPGVLFDSNINVDADNKVVPSEFLNMPFYMALPRQAMPGNGYPLLIYNPGTAGDALQFLRRGQTSVRGDVNFALEGRSYTVADMVTEKGIAVASMAGYMSVEYCNEYSPYSSLGKACFYLAYNPVTSISMIASLYQMVLERVLFRQLLSQIRIPADMCSDAATSTIKFDPERQAGMGQSLGSMVMTAMASVDQKPLQGIVLSGAGNYGLGLPAQFRKFHVGCLVQSVLFNESFSGLVNNPYHPMWALGELALSPANVAVHFSVSQPDTHVLVIEGTEDEQVTTPMQIELLRGLEADFAGVEPKDISEEYRLLPAVLAAGGKHEQCVSENVRGYTRAVVQYHRDEYLTGHHVAFQVPEAREQYAGFLDAVLNGRSPVVGDASCRIKPVAD